MIMKEETEIVIGDNVEICKLSDKNTIYKTKIEDTFPGSVYQVSVPSLNMVPMRINRGDRVELAFYRESGRYIAVMYVMGIIKEGGMRSALLSQSTPFSEEQRRESYRLPVRIKVQVFACAEKSQQEDEDNAGNRAAAEHDVESRAENDAKTRQTEHDAPQTDRRPDERVTAEQSDIYEIVGSRDISATGISFISKKRYEPGNIHKLSLDLDSTSSNQAPSEGTPLVINGEIIRAVKLYESNSYFIGVRFTDQTNSSDERIRKYIMIQQQKMIKKRRRGE